MNKFVLSSFLIIAIFMAQLPSNLACFSKPTTTTPKPPPRIYRTPLEKEVNEYFQSCFPTHALEKDHGNKVANCCAEINQKYGRYGGGKNDVEKWPFPAEQVPECVKDGAGKVYQYQSKF